MPSIRELIKIFDLDTTRPHPGGVDFEGRLLLYTLVQFLRPKKVIEIGVSAGRSSCWLAAAVRDCHNGGKLISVDNWSRDHGGKANSPDRARARLREAGLLDVVTLVSASSHDWFPTQDDNSAEMVWVDGDHSYDGALQDIRNALRVASELVVVHDTVILPDVRRACDAVGGGFHIDHERGFWIRDARDHGKGGK